MAYEMVMPYHLHMPSYFLETFTEYPWRNIYYIGINNERINLSKPMYGKPLNFGCLSKV